MTSLSEHNQNLPVAVIGGGPIGLSAAANLIQRGERPIVFEMGPSVGHNMRTWGHVRLFSPWNYVLDDASVELLETTNWQAPNPKGLPTGDEIVDEYLEPLAALPVMREHIRYNAKVVAISRRGVDKMKDRGREESPFILHIEHADGSDDIVEAKAVIDASGTWATPNPIGAEGLYAVGEKANANRIFYGIPDVLNVHRNRYEGKRVLVVGAGHSAFNALLDLGTLQQSAPDTQLFWALRRNSPLSTFGGGENDELPARGELGSRMKRMVEAGQLEVVAPFRIRRVEQDGDDLIVSGDTDHGVEQVMVDEIIATTGLRPDLEMLRELRLDLHPSLESVGTLGPMIDPNIHSCGTVPPHGEAELRHPEANFYIVGMKSYGRAPTFLLKTGYEQARSVVAALVGDYEAATRIDWVLPETGVCGGDCDVELPANGARVNIKSENLIAVNQIQFGGSAVAIAPAKVSTTADSDSRDCGCEPTCCS
jgi:thioredoxin reductase